MLSYLIALAVVVISGAVAQDDCNPLTTATCPPVRGLNATSYTVDFTKQSGLPPGWVLANYANVTFTPEGAKFWFSQRGNAPYIWTDFHLAYGRVDVELIVSNGTGIVTSSVLFADDLDEIDWEFSGSNFASSSGKAFTNYFGKGVTGFYDRGANMDVTDPQKTFHTYSFDWQPQTLQWIIDGSVRRTLTNNGQNTGGYQYPQTPSRLHIGLWDAGDPKTNPGTVNWAGGYTNYSGVPYVAILKSVKITTPFPCSSWQYPSNFSGKWADVKCTNQTIDSVPNQTIVTVSNPKCTATAYTVSPGDYGTGIAQKFGLGFDAVNASNPGLNWDALVPNEVVKIPCNVTATTTASSTTATDLNSSAGLSSITTTSQLSAILGTTTVTTTTGSSMVVATITGTGLVTVASGPNIVIATVVASSASSISTTNASSMSVLMGSSSQAASSNATGSVISISTSLNTSTLTPSITTTSLAVPSANGSVSSILVTASSRGNMPPGWTYRSCVIDNLNPRSLNTTANLAAIRMTNTACLTWCDQHGYIYAGTEHSGECYCGMQLIQSNIAAEKECNMTCNAAAGQMCGGSARLSLYTKVSNNSSSGSSTATPSGIISVPSTLNTVTIPTPSTPLTGSIAGTSSVRPQSSNVVSALGSGSFTMSQTSPSSTSTNILITAGTTPATSTSTAGSGTASALFRSSACKKDQYLNIMKSQGQTASNLCSTYLSSSAHSSMTGAAQMWNNLYVGGGFNMTSACSCLLSSTVQTTSSTTASSSSSFSYPYPFVRSRPTFNHRRKRYEG